MNSGPEARVLVGEYRGTQEVVRVGKCPKAFGGRGGAAGKIGGGFRPADFEGGGGAGEIAGGSKSGAPASALPEAAAANVAAAAFATCILSGLT